MSIHQLIRTITLQLMAAGLLSASAAGDILATDSFSYPDGQTLYGQSGGTGWTSGWAGANEMVIQSGKASVAIDNPFLFGTYGTRFLVPTTAAWLFYSVEMTTPASFGIDDQFGASTGAGVNNNQIFFGKRSGSPLLEVGLGGWSASAVVAQPNATYHMIGAYHFVPTGPDELLLWINPDGSDFVDVNTGQNSADALRLDFFVFHAQYVNLYGTRLGTAFDNVVISDAPDGVGLGSSAVPEPAGGLAAIVALATGGFTRLRRSRP